MKKISVIIAALLVLSSCEARDNPQTQNPSKPIQIYTTIYPLTFVAEQIGDDLVQVFSVLPKGVEAHGFEPTPKVIGKITDADIFIYNGGGIDSWAERLHENLEVRGVKVVRMIDNFNLIENEGRTDPHIWLDTRTVTGMGRVVRDELVKVDPNNIPEFDSRLNSFIRKVEQLNSQYARTLSECELDTIIVSHNAFQYLGNQYDIKIASISGLSPEQEPSPRHLGEIATLANEKGIKHIFSEELTSKKFVETLAREVGIEVLILHSIESLTKQQALEGKTYISIMEENLKNLSTALTCVK